MTYDEYSFEFLEHMRLPEQFDIYVNTEVSFQERIKNEKPEGCW
jgi:hypothetical protein